MAPWPSSHGIRLSHMMLEMVVGSNPTGTTLLGMPAGWTTSNVTKGGHCGLSTKEPKPYLYDRWRMAIRLGDR